MKQDRFCPVDGIDFYEVEGQPLSHGQNGVLVFFRCSSTPCFLIEGLYSLVLSSHMIAYRRSCLVLNLQTFDLGRKRSVTLLTDAFKQRASPDNGQMFQLYVSQVSKAEDLPQHRHFLRRPLRFNQVETSTSKKNNNQLNTIDWWEVVHQQKTGRNGYDQLL